MPWASSSPARRSRELAETTVATRSPAPASPANVSGLPPRARASASTSANTLPAAAPAMFGPATEATAAASTATFLAVAASSTPVTSLLLDTSSPAAASTSPRFRANPRSTDASTTDAPLSSTSAAPAGPPRTATARAAQRSATNADGGVPRDPLTVGGEHARERAGGDGQAHEIVVGELEVGRARHLDRLGQLDARQVGLVPPGRGHRNGLLTGPATELDLEPRAREQHREACPPFAGPDDRRTTNRREAPEPFPLEHDHRPDPVGDRAGERRRGGIDSREVQLAAGAEPDLARPDPPAPADVFGADDGDRDDGRAALEREPADAALGLAERAGPRARSLGEHQHDLAPPEDDLRRIDRFLVAGPSVHRERPERVQQPGQEAVVGEQLLLGHVVHRASRHRPDHERIEEAPVVGGQDHRALGWDVLAPNPLHTQVDQEERRQDRPHHEQHERIHASLARPPMQLVLIRRRGLVIHRTLRYPPRRRPLQFGTPCPPTASPSVRSAAPSAAPSPPASGRSRNRSTSSSSPAATTTSSSSAEPSATAPAGTASDSSSTSRTARCSAPSTPTSPPASRSRRRSGGPSSPSPSTSPAGPSSPSPTASTPPAATSRPSAATAAPSSRPPSATSSSASSSASSSGVSTPPPSPSPMARRLITPRTATARSSVPSPRCETEPRLVRARLSLTQPHRPPSSTGRALHL